MSTGGDDALNAVAIIGCAGRFPGAPTIHEFWQHLCDGIESVRSFTDPELIASGADPELMRDPDFVRARAVLDGVDQFDAGFFGFTAREAEITDPQHRLFLECAWEAMEDGGHDPARYPGSIGVYAGSSLNTYLLHQIFGTREAMEVFTRGFQADGYPILVGNDKEYLTTRVAYKLGLRGPAVAIQTACSTSLVAVCQAVAAVTSYQCDMALAGGASISFPQERGYLYQEGAIASADGHCRVFDAQAKGTVFGAGVGVVLLRRLADAVAEGDHIYAVIKGAAVNNDGADKVSFSAPSVNGQAAVITMAQAQAGVTADEISYVEAHGTGTPLGDPIEVAALTQAFRATTDRKQFCALGSVKGNVGHLEAAAGVTGLIKTALALKKGVIPPTLHFERPNPKCDFESTPFHVVTQPTPWKTAGGPRRAGVSSFGIGGTNAHVVLEEAPAVALATPSRPMQLLVLSARSGASLQRMTDNLASHLEQNPQLELADVAFTLQTGRRAFPHRRAVVVGGCSDAVASLRSPDAKAVLTRGPVEREAGVVFLFPGQGAQYVGMGRELYQTERTFREHVDRCSEVLLPLLGVDLRSVLYPIPGSEAAMSEGLRSTSLAQPALFVIEFALAQLWMSWGIRPAALVGHSIGEYVAAVLAGVMSLEEGMALIAERARLMQNMPHGAMLSVRLAEPDVRPLLTGRLAVAAVNSPKLCVVAGPPEEVAALEAVLESRRVASKRLPTSHAFHSPMMEPVVAPFTERVRQANLRASRLPIVSTHTGQWIAPEDWTKPSYWAQQLREPVRFAEAMATLAKDPDLVLLEVGPGQTLATLARQQPDRPKEQCILASLPPIERPGETLSVLTTLGRLWLAGVGVDWMGVHAPDQRRRVSLPTYAFERQRHWVEAPRPTSNRAPLPGGPQAEANAPGRDNHGASSLAGSGARGEPSSRLEDVIGRQLALMQEQLAALGQDRTIESIG